MKANGSARLDRSFLCGRTMGEAVVAAREEVASVLIVHNLVIAAHATRAAESFGEWWTMRERMLAGGLHRVRLYGGRNIDGVKRAR